MKICTKCKSELPETEFSKHPLGKGGLRPHCKPCDRAMKKNWRANNLEKARKYNREWQKKNPELSNELRKKCVAKRRAHYNEKRRQYYALNKTEILATRALWREENRDHLAQYSRLKKARRILRERTAVGRYTALEIKALYAEQDGKCVYCKCELNGKFHRDHKMPLVLGGDNTISNIQLTCAQCNYSKGCKHPEEFRMLAGRRAAA